MDPVRHCPVSISTSSSASQIAYASSFIDGAFGAAEAVTQRVLQAALSAVETVGSCIGSIKPAKHRATNLTQDAESKKHETVRWLFSQQFDDVCHAIPWLNLRRLESFKSGGYKLDDLEAYTRREWFGKDFIHWQTWHSAIAACVKGKEGTAVQLYMNRLVQDGPVMPHFYDNKGKSILNGLYGILQAFLMPHGIIDLEGFRNFNFTCAGITLTNGDKLVPTLGLNVPIVRENGEYQIFDRRTQQFEKLENDFFEEEKGHQYDNGRFIKFKELSEEQRQAYGLPNQYRQLWLYLTNEKQERALGYETIAFTSDIGSALAIGHGEYTCYLTSIYKIMLLALGVDANNEELNENSTEYAIHIALKQVMQDPENPWHEDLFSKEKLLEYQIAQLFKMKPELFEETKKAVNFLLTPWNLVEQLKANEVYRADGTPYKWDEIKEFLPGEEQLAAYYLTLMVRSLWTGAINPEAFDKSIGIKIPFLWKLFRYTSHPLVQVWKKVVAELKSLDRESFVSFAGHGFVMDFSQTLQALQNGQTGVHDPSLLRELGFAGIESWLGSQLKNRVFYSK